MLELWKPIQTLNDEKNSVIFSPLCFKYSSNYSKNKSIRPFVIFYDDQEDCYYYLKSQGAYYSANHRNKDIAGTLKKPKQGEILISYSEDGGLFKKETYVDCSQIFKCDRQLLESLVDKECDLFKKTKQLSNHNINGILQGIRSCIFQVPPYLSIIEVKQNNDGETFGESLYLCKDKLSDEVEKMDEFDLESNGIDEDMFLSENYAFGNNERYEAGIDFCFMFLNKYFPDEIDNFVKTQELESFDSKDESYLKYHILPYSPYGKAQPFVINSLDEFDKHLNSLDEYDLEKVVISKYNDEDLYNDCSELLKKLKEDIKAKDRGGDGGMSM